MALFSSLFKRKKSPKVFLDYLKAHISGNMSLEEMVDVFMEMCQIPSHAISDMKLFQTGLVPFSEDALFRFNLTRQIPNDDEEFYQIQLDVLFPLEETLRDIHDSIWNEDLDGDFFAHVKKSAAFCVLNEKTMVQHSVFVDET